MRSAVFSCWNNFSSQLTDTNQLLVERWNNSFSNFVQFLVTASVWLYFRKWNLLDELTDYKNQTLIDKGSSSHVKKEEVKFIMWAPIDVMAFVIPLSTKVSFPLRQTAFFFLLLPVEGKFFSMPHQPWNRPNMSLFFSFKVVAAGVVIRERRAGQQPDKWALTSCLYKTPSPWQLLGWRERPGCSEW